MSFTNEHGEPFFMAQEIADQIDAIVGDTGILLSGVRNKSTGRIKAHTWEEMRDKGREYWYAAGDRLRELLKEDRPLTDQIGAAFKEGVRTGIGTAISDRSESGVWALAQKEQRALTAVSSPAPNLTALKVDILRQQELIDEQQQIIKLTKARNHDMAVVLQSISLRPKQIEALPDAMVFRDRDGDSWRRSVANRWQFKTDAVDVFCTSDIGTAKELVSLYGPITIAVKQEV